MPRPLPPTLQVLFAFDMYVFETSKLRHGKLPLKKIKNIP